MFNFLKKFFHSKSYHGTYTIDDGKTLLSVKYPFANIDIDLPTSPVFGQVHEWDGFFVEYEGDCGKKYKKQFSRKFVFDGKNWRVDQTPVEINVGEERGY